VLKDLLPAGCSEWLGVVIRLGEPTWIGISLERLHLHFVPVENSLGFCNSLQMNPPEAYIQFTLDLVTNEGEVTNDSTAEFLAQFMGEFHLFIAGVFGSAERCVEA
jgi:chromate reductase